MKSQIPVVNKSREEKVKKEDVLNRLSHVQIVVQDEKVKKPPRGIDINIDM